MRDDAAQGRIVRSINQALTRPETVAGAEKKPLGFVVAGGVMFAFFTWLYHSPPSLFASAFLLFVGVPQLRRIAKADPQMFAVFAANWFLRAYYAARAAARDAAKA